MKLFLSSIGISAGQAKAFIDLVGKPRAEDISIALIENAADTYEEEKKQWMYDSRNEIIANGFHVDLVDLEEYRTDVDGLTKRLEKADVIWLGGGNTYYLRWILQQTRADEVIRRLAQEGKVYGGGSAGAIVAGPTLKHFESADHPEEAPEVVYEGLSLTDVVVVPHWADPSKYGAIMKGAEAALQNDGFKTVHLTNAQALVIDDSNQKIIPL